LLRFSPHPDPAIAANMPPGSIQGPTVRARHANMQQRGFTLIELVVVIAIVAITSAMVLPRVWHWQREARIGQLNYARGVVHTAAMLIHSATLSRDGRPDLSPCPAGGGTADNALDGAGSVCTEDGLVRTQHGYPASAAPGTPGIVAAAGLGSVFNAKAEQLRAQGYEVRVDGPVTTISSVGAPDPARCSFTYTEPPAARTAATISVSVLSGC